MSKKKKKNNKKTKKLDIRPIQSVGIEWKELYLFILFLGLSVFLIPMCPDRQSAERLALGVGAYDVSRRPLIDFRSIKFLFLFL